MAVKTHFTDVENDTPTESNIPSRDGRWKYPSQKQFYNATTRNGIDISYILCFTSLFGIRPIKLIIL